MKERSDLDSSRQRPNQEDTAELTPEFRSSYPLLAARLNRPEHVQLFNRVVSFFKFRSAQLADTIEKILREHEAGADYVEIETKDSLGIQPAEVLAFYTQAPITKLRQQLFPDLKVSGMSGRVAYFAWRIEGTPLEHSEAMFKKAFENII